MQGNKTLLTVKFSHRLIIQLCSDLSDLANAISFQLLVVDETLGLNRVRRLDYLAILHTLDLYVAE